MKLLAALLPLDGDRRQVGDLAQTNVPELHEGLIELTHTESYRSRALEVASAIAAEGGVARAVEMVEAVTAEDVVRVYETYIKEARAAKCFECTKVWRDMRRRQEEELDILLQHFKKHIDAGMVDFGSE